MIEYFKAKEEGAPGKLHILLHLTDEFIEDLKSGVDDEYYKKCLLEFLDSEIVEFIKTGIDDRD